ncbi:TrkA family potassium uptake protein [uncultured Limosilactobacillus sp.]|uniref:potassium channel family protein n=1 Tax=uncultured Limosilactobacillus sp. TaxID=2837629 RepID=UPI0025D04E79|nr:TrkA family potassium uptake protein [uncultured Limosilactobacillus sp.]
MAKKESYVVIGLGKFGMTICSALAQAGQEVLAIDSNPDVVNEVSHLVVRAVIANAEEEETLKELAVGNFDHVYISIGHNIEASIMATLIVKELGAPDVTCRAENIHHARVLERVGADTVVRPEHDIAERLVFRKLNPNVVDFVRISENLMLAEVTIRNPKFFNRSLGELEIRRRFNVNVIAILDHQDQLNEMPMATDTIHDHDKLTVIGSQAAIEQLSDEVDR